MKIEITAHFKQRNKFVFGNVHVCIVHIKYHVHIAYEMVMCICYTCLYGYMYMRVYMRMNVIRWLVLVQF